ncbi:YdbH domain-containing protein [Emcibacter sp. SYSU 3D8]|uniref:intermembrane phospholipid transport protein YdbH family protein n=1 Tax=Emcibacter sp. SYSU 3D8 TaxID=3133969 RepID=UPI0031FEFC29
MTLRSSWRRRSRAFRILTGIVAVLASAVLALWIFRASLTEWAIESSIDGMGLGPSDVRVTDLGLAQADMRLVSSAAGTIDRIHVDYRIGDLLGGAVRHMIIDGARLRFEWKDGKLAPAITSSEGPIILPLDRLDIRNSSLTLDVNGDRMIADVSGAVTGKGTIGVNLAMALRMPQGQVTGRLTGAMQPDGALAGTFTISGGDLAAGSVKAEMLTGTLQLAASAQGIELIDGAFGFARISGGTGPLGPGRLSASLRQPQNVLNVALQSRPVSFSLQADGAAPGAGVPFTMEGTADAAFVSGLAGADKPAEGGVHLKASGMAPPGPTMQAAFASGLGDWLRLGKAQATLDGTASGLGIPDMVSVNDAVVSLEINLADGGLTVTTPRGITVNGMKLAPALAAKGSLFAGRSNLSIAPAPGAPFLAITPQEVDDRLTFSGNVSYETPSLFVRGDIAGAASLDPSQWLASARDVPAKGDIELKTRLVLKLPENRHLPSAELSMAGNYDVGPQTIRLVADSGALTLRNAQWGETVSLPGTSRLVLQPGAAYAMDRASGAVSATAVAAPLAWTAQIKREGAEPAKMTLGAKRVALTMDDDGLNAVLGGGRAEMSDSGVAARGIQATITQAGGTTRISAAIADVRSTQDPALFPSSRVSLSARLAGSKATFSAGLAGAGSLLDLSAKGRHDLDSGKGNANFALKPIDLSGVGTLKALSPKLASSVTKSSGTVSGEGSLSWGPDAPPGTLTLALKDITFVNDSLNVSALNGGFRLESLTPMRSAGGQTLSGILQLPTVNAVPFDVRFRLEPGKLVLEHASAQVFDGKFETEDAEIDAATGDGRMNLKVSDIDLKTAFAVLDLDQLKGTGRIGGRLPLRIESGRVAIENGHLESSIAGTLQVGVDKLADQLLDYGENVDMAFRALTDFHYDRMVIDTDKPFAGSGKAMFRLEGHNPAVMDGHPFIFNISLETDFDYLTSLMLELSGAANTALGWGARELGRK